MCDFLAQNIKQRNFSLSFNISLLITYGYSSTKKMIYKTGPYIWRPTDDDNVLATLLPAKKDFKNKFFKNVLF